MEEKKIDINTVKNTKIIINNLSTTNLTGVTKVFSATENIINLKLGDINICIEGENLHVIKLDIDSGNVDIEGEIFKIKRENSKQQKGFFKRIFK